ncbi:hypothetical protein BD769DRAFT_1362958, partial [Suillus cothurnatus]
LPVFHRIKWLSVDAHGHSDATAMLDSVHARPQASSGSGLWPRHSDTALVNISGNLDVASGGIEGMFSHHYLLRIESLTSHLNLGVHVGQVQVIFSLPSKSLPLLFLPTVEVPNHLAYIKWFTPFPSAPNQHHRLYKLSQVFCGGKKLVSIMPLANIVCSVHLILNFGAIVP